MTDIPIGGYFELETTISGNEYFYSDLIALNSARNCLEYILHSKRYTKIYIPFYTCDVILEPLEKLGIRYDFYDTDLNLEPLFDFSEIKDSEAFLYTNYFGLKDNYIQSLSEKIPDSLIIDNAQALFSKPIAGIKTFYSPRKFIGVADGGYLYTDKKLNTDFDQDTSYERMSHLLKRIDVSAEEAYSDFCKNDASLEHQPIKKMSKLTEKILKGANLSEIRKKRRENFSCLHESLKERNLLTINFDNDCVPMVYPFRTKNTDTRNTLISNRIYCATYWPNVLKWCDQDKNAFALTNEIIALPIDQRYSTEHMKKILEYV